MTPSPSLTSPPALHAAPRGRVRTLGKTLLLASLGIANVALLASLLTSAPQPTSVNPTGTVAASMPLDLSGIDLSAFDPASPAYAAAAQQAGRPSEYLMIPARLTSVNQDVVYIIDTQTGDLTAAAYDAQQGIQFIDPLRLSQVFDGANR